MLVTASTGSTGGIAAFGNFCISRGTIPARAGSVVANKNPAPPCVRPVCLSVLVSAASVFAAAPVVVSAGGSAGASLMGRRATTSASTDLKSVLAGCGAPMKGSYLPAERPNSFKISDAAALPGAATLAAFAFVLRSVFWGSCRLARLSRAHHDVRKVRSDRGF